MGIFKSKEGKKRKKAWALVSGVLAAVLTGIAVFLPFSGKESSEPEPEEPPEEEPLETTHGMIKTTHVKVDQLRVDLGGGREGHTGEVGHLGELWRELGDEPYLRHKEIEEYTLDLTEAEERFKGLAGKKPE